MRGIEREVAYCQHRDVDWFEESDQRRCHTGQQTFSMLGDLNSK